jgi:hypothetical protein
VEPISSEPISVEPISVEPTSVEPNLSRTLPSRHPIILTILFILIFILSLSGILFGLNKLIGTSTYQAGLSPTIPKLIVNLPPGALRIVTEAPIVMQVRQSYIVKVTLTPKGQKYISTLMIEKATPTASNTNPVGTPGATFGNAFGNGYVPFASAKLFPSSGPFTNTLISPLEQSLEQQQVVWTWSIVPSEESYGNVFLSVNIFVTWKSASRNLGPFPLGEQIIGVHIAAPPATPTPTLTSTPAPTSPDYWTAIATVSASTISGIAVIIAALVGTPYFRRWLRDRSRNAKSTPPTNQKTPP